jgi:hypothetical protein
MRNDVQYLSDNTHVRSKLYRKFITTLFMPPMTGVTIGVGTAYHSGTHETYVYIFFFICTLENYNGID